MLRGGSTSLTAGTNTGHCVGHWQQSIAGCHPSLDRSSPQLQAVSQLSAFITSIFVAETTTTGSATAVVWPATSAWLGTHALEQVGHQNS